MSSFTSGENSGSSGEPVDDDISGLALQQPSSSGATAPLNDSSGQHQPPVKRKRNLPGTPDPDAEVVALSPKTLMATNRFVCEICNKGFQRDQNLQLHRRGHNLPWKLRQRTSNEIRKRVYICPEPSCVHHDPARALGDLTGIKKHFCRKHGEKKWKCDKCSKRYAVQSDWKAHLKTCGTREYRCDCGTLFSRRDSFTTHRAFCDALAEETARVSAHRQGGSQQSGALSAVPLSPHGANSQLTGDPPDALLSSEISKTGMSDVMSDFTSTEKGIASLSSKCIQGATAANSSLAAPSKGTGLSLWLGTGPGPGPPGALQMMGGGLLASTPLDFRPPYLSRAMNESGVSGMIGSVASSFASGQNANNAISGMSSFAGLTERLDRGPAMPGFGLPSAGSISALNNFGGDGAPSVSSVFNQQQHSATGTAQMSATALLQKAAQMGATASSPSQMWGFGLGNGDRSSGPSGGARQLSGQVKGRAGAVDILSSSMPSFPLMSRTGDASFNNQGVGNSFGSSSFLGQKRFNESSGIQEFMNSLSGGSGLFGGGIGNAPSSLAPSYGANGARTYIQDANNFLKHHMPSDNPQDSQSNLMHGRSPFQPGTSQVGVGGLLRCEDASDRTTLDFLGVGGPSGMAGVPAGMGRILSERDLASITSLGTGMKMEPFTNQTEYVQPVGARGQSPGKSWDSS